MVLLVRVSVEFGMGSLRLVGVIFEGRVVGGSFVVFFIFMIFRVWNEVAAFRFRVEVFEWFRWSLWGRVFF